jgi:glycosyltransferase involved in cell wall biosynthesis
MGMRIGLDARELCGRTTGAGRYLGGLLARWSDDPDAKQHEFVLYAPGSLPISLDSRRFASRTVSGTGGTWWEQIALPATVSGDHLDVWFSPAYTAPLRLRVPTVVAIHDLSFLAHPEWFRVPEGARRRLFCRWSAARARAVITISEFSRRELMDRLQVPSGKIRVIPPGIETVGSTRDPWKPPTRFTILFVGSIFNRRHVTDLIRAFGPIAREHPEAALEIVGDNRSYPHEDLLLVIAREGLDAQVKWHRYVDDKQLRELYAQARAFAFLSEYEGLGLTPLEALSAGIPPVLLDTAVARESCGDAAIYVPPGDLPATTRALELALFSEETRSRVLAGAAQVLARYSWARAARETLAVLEGAA